MTDDKKPLYDCVREHEGRKHLDEKELEKLMLPIFEAHGKLIVETQKTMEKMNVCEGDFLTVLATSTALITAATIEHLVIASQLDKQETINLIMTGICDRVGATFVSINAAKLVKDVKRAANITEH